ncbi:hypothetical protein A2246_00205 [candidate division WOR-1 bacterium RIFOXYA2_FULL_37_7]|uniref:Class II aldolase/adducin N-terminal domain-containing protein n=1 Tax=candidate division WOR-1 bacterium RIFOXYB2_FULL_37_13 TaxID=1802579 RepID=A0A1F4SHN4_UNCSA|nr:MAG: hypothetical protein A2246_00205 [candidate division WOR-1 bacterium RIFOXYA2_FULL_37_7]OGC19944.1 MAG: hypothetical protein A2310_08700 [candidate division WOR-1 bacterium RIFOXYB2_FULL_37_13]
MEKEIKVFPKFAIKFLSESFPKDRRIEMLKFWFEEFLNKKLMPKYEGGVFGNLSFRLKDNKDEFIITASGMKEPSSADSFIKVSLVDLKKKEVYAHGKNPPSSESMFHFMIYKKRQDINAIFHGHCEEMLKNCNKLKLPCTEKEEPYGTIELANGILEVLDNHSFLIIKNHGFISLGKDMDSAGNQAIDYLLKTFA